MTQSGHSSSSDWAPWTFIPGALSFL